jgi:predicted small secreted protein
MKTAIVIVVLAMLTACSTVGGAVQGLGEDVKSLTDWTASKINP